MTNEGTSSLSFSMKEGIWLERGYEADGLMSLELEPDISISETGEEVSIQGVLNLTGEYRVKKEADNHHSHVEGEDLTNMSFRSVEEVSFSDEGTGHMHHQFPLDITIPRERIKDLSELAVKVDTFDYHVPERGFLEISAELSIEGIKSEEDLSEEVVTEELHDKRSFSFEQIDAEPKNEDNEKNVSEERGEPEQASDGETERDSPEENDERAHDSPHYTLKAAAEETPLESKTVQEDTPLQSNQVEETPLSKQVQEETEKADQDRSTQVSEEKSHDDFKETRESEPSDYREEVTANQQENEREEPQDVERPDEEPEKTEEVGRDEVEEPEQGNALYLTKMLAGDQEAYSKLRMCIVQSGESLNTIADRYNIQPSQLIRMNRLKDEDVSEGQILYIPVKQSSSLD
ncbi:LysM peptidoglycan-binding domain-containing protein [Salipaludibacillus sp. LMS25]|uniref:LysM peptidoglycan-binding domain-containing protein n=1 Tax=Salipaludibacillus sp. LMS25 TaxID=2924031 RepID=UPI0020D0E7E2|nr:LysM peptidoglycan-binding domain-containing protein [Salipaludibacillus sp. LMS25]UTR15484.1 LysM peptidoglycan-binding domain-containing protein [Salipaludibacillus sp. LMS25]